MTKAERVRTAGMAACMAAGALMFAWMASWVLEPWLIKVTGILTGLTIIVALGLFADVFMEDKEEEPLKTATKAA